MNRNASVANEDFSTEDVPGVNSDPVNVITLPDNGNQRDIRDYLEYPLTPAAMSFSGVVDANIERDKGKRDGKRDPSMAQFAEVSGEAFADLAEEIEEMGNIFFDYVNGKTIKGTWRYISDVFLYRDEQSLHRAVEVLRGYGRTRRDRMFGFSVEDDHIHIIHDCSFSGGHCRDIFRKQMEPYGSFGPTRTENKPIWKFTRTDWYDVFVYFFLRKRGTREIWIGGKSWQKPSDAQLVRWTEKLDAWRPLVRLEDCRTDDFGKRSSNKRPGGEIDWTCNSEVYGKKAYSAGKYGYIKGKTKALLVKYFCSPVSAIRDVREFRDDDLLSDPKNREYIQSAFDDFGRDINDYTLRDFYNILTADDCKPIFFASMNYGTREDSFVWIDELLKYQFDDDIERITQFLHALVDIIDKKIPKCNSLCVKSPPSAGKNFFFDMILAILLNYGQLGQANRNNNFAFQEAPNKRVLVWNEPNYESSLTDTIKMMLGGDPYTVRVKHGMDTHVRRTPVLILTNTIVGFMVDHAFEDRICKYEWKTAPFLKEIEQKPYPMCIFDIFNKYNVEFYIIIFLLELPAAVQ